MTSYMELCLHIDRENNVYLRVPTVWDEIEKQWIGFVKTPKTQKLLHAKGKTSFDLQNDFNKTLKKSFEDPEISDEVFSMFQPRSYWDEME